MQVELNVNPWVKVVGNQLQFEEVTTKYVPQKQYRKLESLQSGGVTHNVCVVKDKVQLALGAS